MPIVKLEECTGCGACVAVCPAGAIRMVASAIEIDANRCEECGACVAACPSGALVMLIPAAATRLPAARPQRAPAPVVAAPAYRPLAPLTGAALTFLGREVAPRVIDLLITALERRLDTHVSASPSCARVTSGVSKPGRSGLRGRYRGGSEPA